MASDDGKKTPFSQTFEQGSSENPDGNSPSSDSHEQKTSVPSQEAAPVLHEPQESAKNQNSEKPLNKGKKRKRSFLVRNPLIILGNFALTIICIAVIVCLARYYSDRAAFEEPGPTEQSTVITIRPGAGFGEIATLLEKEQIITRAGAFKSGVSYYEQSNRLKAGEYEIPAFASMHDVMDILVAGKSIEYSLTIPEGLTVQQVFYRIRDNEQLTGDLPSVLPPEGSLLTDTVRFTRGTTREEVVRRLIEGQKKRVQAIWDKRAPGLPLKNINEFVTLASIVEKESAIPSERPMVAAVFYNRMAKNMRLDSDPTFLYGIYGGEGKPADKVVTREDRLSDTPYNTYRIKGLPPTPIANPGRGALEAVANPAKTDALFFVADGSGGHAFSATLQEHNRNVDKWRLYRAGQQQ